MTIKQQGGVFGRNPTFNNLEVDGTGTVDGDLTVNGFGYFNDRLTVTDDHVRVVYSPNTSRLEVGVDSTSAYLKTFYSSGGTRDLRFLSLNSEIARITANGITFGGDTAAANALDDYEEGTFTPVVADASSGGNEAAGYTSQIGRYTKIGRIVNVLVYLTNINTTGMTAGNDVFITGLPFAALSGVIYPGAVRLSDITFAGNVSAEASSGNTFLRLCESVSAAGVDRVMVSELQSGVSDIAISITYEV